MKKDFFPFYLNIKEKKFLVIGGGIVATRRILSLCNFSFEITVISPEISDEINQLVTTKQVEYINKEFSESDLIGFDFVLAATSDRKVNEKIGECAKKMEQMVNVADKKEECDFYFPAFILDENTTVSLIGDGSCHKKVKNTASKIREVLNEN